MHSPEVYVNIEMGKFVYQSEKLVRGDKDSGKKRMDGLFLAEDDIMGPNSHDYKPFDLISEWRVSPNSEHFSLQSPEFAQNYVDKVNLKNETATDTIEIKQEIKVERTSPVPWFTVIQTKEPWKENCANSFEEKYLTEQVVPDPVTVMECKDQKNDIRQPCDNTSRNTDILNDTCTEEMIIDSENLSNDTVNNSSGKSVKSESSNNSIFISDDKEQVNSTEDSFETTPADDMLNFSDLCDGEHLNKISKTDETLSCEESKHDNRLACTKSAEHQTPEQFRSSDEENVTNFDNPIGTREELNKEIKNANFDAKFEEKQVHFIDQAKVDIQQRSKIDLERIQRKIFRFLTSQTIPKCTMVKYRFDSSDKLPSFEDTFSPPDFDDSKADKENIELPRVLEDKEKDSKIEGEFVVLLSDNESDCDDMDIDKKPSSESQSQLKNENSSAIGISKDNVKPESKMEIKGDVEQRMNSGTQVEEIHSEEVPSNILGLDDELENFLVSNMILNDDQSGSTVQLPDLSENLGSILRNDNLSEDNPLDSVYRQLFSRNSAGAPVDNVMWNRTQRQDPAIKLRQSNDMHGNLFSTPFLPSGGRAWQDHVNRLSMNAMYGNIWRNAPINEAYIHHINTRHFTNNGIFPAAEPFIHSVPKNMLGLPPDVLQTDVESFNFSNTAARVEVVDSSLNYEF